MCRTLAVDISSTNCGWSIWCEDGLVDCGIITPPKKDKKAKVYQHNAGRITYLAEKLIDLILVCDIVSVEAPQGGAQNAKAASALDQSYATICSVCTALKKPLFLVSLYDVKRAATGKHIATKKDMMDAAIERVGGSKQKNGRGINFVFSNYDRSISFSYCKTKFEHVADSFFVYAHIAE